MISRLFAFVLLLFCIPLVFLTCLFLLVFEGAKIMFFQDRLGKNKKVFSICKFRTMKDGRVTKIGKILRRTGIDEIPQLINIIKGEMTFVGPRPLTQGDVDRLGWNDSFYNNRWDVKPGLSGLAQLSPRCHKKMSFFLDAYYSKNKSILLNLKIITVSGLAVVLGKKKAKRIYFKR